MRMRGNFYEHDSDWLQQVYKDIDDLFVRQLTNAIVYMWSYGIHTYIYHVRLYEEWRFGTKTEVAWRRADIIMSLIGYG